MIENLKQDCIFTLRALRRAPGFSAAIIVTLALGIGANAAMFSLTDRLFVRPPAGVVDPAGIRRLYVRSNWSVGSQLEIRREVAYPAFLALDSSLTSRARVAGYTKPDSMLLIDANAETTVRGSYATADYMSLLGVRPALGRFYTADEDIMGRGALVAVISYALWQRQFDSDPSVVDRVVGIEHKQYTIIGVLQRGFAGTDLNATDVWLPLATRSAAPSKDAPWFTIWRSDFIVRVLARVAPNTPEPWISAVGTTVLRRGELANVSWDPDTSATVLTGPLLESLGPTIKPPPEIAISKRLAGVTLIVLLIACANVANLLLARAITRRREVAIRLALGISRPRLIAQLLSESVILSIVAGIAAIFIGVWIGGALRTIVLPDTHWVDSVLDHRIAVFTAAAALVTGLVAGLVPALQASRPDLTTALKAGSRDGGGNALHARLRASLIVGQVALSVVLLHGAGLFVRSLSGVRAIDVGYDADRLIYATMKFVNPQGRYVEYSPPNPPEFSRGLEETAARLAGLPGVEGTAVATSPPMGGYAMQYILLQSGAEAPMLDNRPAAIFSVSPSYFATTGLHLARGRFFTEADRDGPPVIVVSETAAKTFWPGREVLGQCLLLPPRPCANVIGVTRDAHLMQIVESPRMLIFAPFARGETAARRYAQHLVVRTSPDHASRVAEQTRRELRRRFPEGDYPEVTSMAQALEPQLRPWRLGASLFSAFGILALVVAAIGVYSVIAYSVSQRSHEMSVRVALGAQAEQLMRMVVGQGVRVIAVGVALGIGIALALSRLVASLLYETSTHDPVVMTSVALLLLVVAVLASAAPAWRAMRADPVTALRAE